MSGKSHYLGELTYRQMDILRRMSLGDEMTTVGLEVKVGVVDPVITNHYTRMGLEREGLIHRVKVSFKNWKTYQITPEGRERVEAFDSRWPKHWRAAFTDDQVREMRKRYDRWQKIKAEKQVTIEGLAEEYGVSTSCIGNILNRDTYKGVE